MHLLFSSNLDDYKEALKRISQVVAFFHSHPVFTPENAPGLDQNIEKLIMELDSINFEQLYNLWSAFGGDYLPSVLYKLRMVTIFDEPKAIVPPVASVNLHPQHA